MLLEMLQAIEGLASPGPLLYSQCLLVAVYQCNQQMCALEGVELVSLYLL